MQNTQKTYNICASDLSPERLKETSKIVMICREIHIPQEFIADLFCACLMDIKVYAQALIWLDNGLKAYNFHKLERKLKSFNKEMIKKEEKRKQDMKDILNNLRGIVRF